MIFLIAGCFIDANSAMYIFIPVMIPVCRMLGFDPVVFGIIATVNLAIGQVTPPVGINLFVAISLKIKNVAKVTLPQISRAVIPMIAASLVVLIGYTYWPRAGVAVQKANSLAGNGSKVALWDSEQYDAKKDAAPATVEWPPMTWHFACSPGETCTWAKAGRYFAALMKESTGGKVTVLVDGFSDQLTNGSQPDGIAALREGDPIQLSMHSNLIYSALDDRFNVVSLPYIYNNYEDADAKFDGEQNSVEGQENPLPSIASASVQSVQKYISLWNAYYDCLFFCMNGDVYNSLNEEQKRIVDENAQKAVDFERAINRYECDELIKDWKEKNIISVVETSEIDIESFKKATAGVADWYKKQLLNNGHNPEAVEKLISSFAE